MRTPRFAWSLLVAFAAVTAACGDAKSSLNPTAPSVVSSASASADAGGHGVESGATANGGNGNGNGNGNNGSGNSGNNGSNGNGGGNTGNHGGGNPPSNPPGSGGNDGGGNPPSNPPGSGGNNGGGNPPSNTPGSGGPSGNTTPAAPGQAKVEFEGLVTAVGASSVEVSGQTILVNADTVIRHGNRRFELSDLRRGDRVHVRAARLTSAPAGSPSLQAMEIRRQNPGDEEEPAATVPPPPAPTGLVSVTAADAQAGEWPVAGSPDTGTFRLTRIGDASLLAAPLTVTFTLAGTASNGADYTNLPSTATFAAGADTTEVVVTPINDEQTDGEETVVLTLTTVSPYELGSPASASLTIAPAPTGRVTVSATDALASERATATGPDTGSFRLTRDGDARLLASPLTVAFTLTGTATNGSDYNLPVTATFAAGVATVDLLVTPLADTLDDSDESVVLTLTTVTPYELGSPASATVDIAHPKVSVEAVDADATEAGDTGTFRLTRTGDLSRSMSVTIRFSGTAVNGTDYRLTSSTVVFSAGQATRDIVITPVTDTRVDPSETVILSITDTTEYDLGTPSSATITVTGT